MSSQTQRVLAIALDAPSHDLLGRWLEAGQLPNLRSLRERGRSFTIESRKAHSNKHSWIPVLTGQSLDRWDHWIDRWTPATYRFDEASLFDWHRAPLFYALGGRRRVVAFDLSAPLVEGVQGVQVSGFTAESNESFPESDPPGLLDELIARVGPDPKLGDASAIVNGVSGRAGVSWTVPCAYDAAQMRGFAQGLVSSVDRRTRACLHLMQEQPWDLFIAAYSEVHTADHILWHLSEPHPLAVLREAGEPDPVLAVYRAMDRSIGELVRAAGPQTSVVFFTVDDTVCDSLENARAVFLPEFLHRLEHGRAALAEGRIGETVPEPRLDYREHWKHELWRLRTPHGDTVLESPAAQAARGDPLAWCPANWYRPLWPKMQALAFPSFADGYVRINVAGREAAGCVDPARFNEVCERLARDLYTLVNARTGRGVVGEVQRVRTDPFDADPKKPPADLIVVFREDGPLDAVESPLVGRIGPVPYFRTSGHRSQGAALRNWMFLAGPGIAPSLSDGGTGQPQDVPATLLDLMGLERPAHFDGVSRLG
jgi:hypothetical protein